MSAVEIAGAFLGVAYVILAIKSNAWCWLAGILSALLYIIFDLQLKYFQDAILQSYYVIAGGYGWYLWTRKSAEDQTLIQSYDAKRLLPWLALGFILFPIMGYGFSKLGNSFSYIDAFTTVFSFIATYFTAKKVIESWLMWILLNLVFIVQYFLKEAYVTSALYLFLGIMAVVGYQQWSQQISTKNVMDL